MQRLQVFVHTMKPLSSRKVEKHCGHQSFSGVRLVRLEIGSLSLERLPISWRHFGLIVSETEKHTWYSSGSFSQKFLQGWNACYFYWFGSIFLASNLQKMLKLVKIHEKWGKSAQKIGKIRQFLTKLPCVCEISAWSEPFLPAKTGFPKIYGKKLRQN